MKPEIKKKWVEALRSGQYKQCQGKLTDGAGFCCLGVLTNLYLLEKGETWKRNHHDEVGVPINSNGLLAVGTLPMCVQEWAGLKSDDPVAGDRNLSEWNDDMGKRFTSIANLIEKHL